ncbi:TonB-dependent receptor [Sphingobium chlorophenolicum L-1]|uniref:TonB-dependent receptor n=2 Tax=Sphingobium chlorophenolicum TaxID=46429 RepID=F6F3N5_SPHCR|nr:TonB-dependent receptor [Sphingobium chlorophenolicum]AEG51047.1 TonB-dependent receptor [Sphingobium chlorophenolicum L-1]
MNIAAHHAALLIGVSSIGLLAASAHAQEASAPSAAIADIVVTAQRQSETLQSVPISISAFSGEALEKQQIKNALDLQLSLPNVTFTKTNFTNSSFTIRGVGDLCVGASCESATGIHVNDMPTITRLFETEYFDLQRIEVLRGPQGTLYGRNATSGVVNFITNRPDLTKFGASGEIEYGNYKSVKVKGMINIPLSDRLGVRLAGYYLNRDGYTKDIANNSRIDGRDLYALRGTVRFQPSDATTLDIIGYYFREKDDRNRVGKQLCHRDTSGVLGCAPDRLGYDVVNGHATITGILTNSEVIGPLGWTSRSGPDIYAGIVNPADMRTVNSGYTPRYFAEDKQLQIRWEQKIGDTLDLGVIGGYTKTEVDSQTDYFGSRGRSISTFPGIPIFQAVFPTAAASLFDSAGNICASAPDRSYAGVYGGNRQSCMASPTTADRSTGRSRAYSLEAHLTSHFDGKFNFLAGGIYYNVKSDYNFFIAGTGFDYAAAIIGPPELNATHYLGPSFYNSETSDISLKSYGIFGEIYYDLNDRLKFTAGMRYSSDKKPEVDRAFLYNFPVPYGSANALTSPFFPLLYDQDPAIPGNQANRILSVKFGEITGRALLDWQVTDDNLLYLSASRGYKSGGINPPFDPSLFTAPATFKPEIIQALEIGSKNKFAGGKLVLNASAFYYDYSNLQLSRLINRTAFNDNTNASIYGVEIESVIRPDPAWQFNLSASYLHSKIKNFSLDDSRDPSGGRSDTVIVKDAASAANCVVQPTGAITAQALFAAAPALGALQPVTGTNTSGVFSSCAAILQMIAEPPPAISTLLGVAPGGPLPFAFNRDLTGAPLSLPSGVAVPLSGNRLPQAPTWKFSAGAQHVSEFDNGMSLVLRVDLTYTGEYFSRSFNRPVDRIKGYEVVNAQAQLNGQDDKWFVRAFVQNLTANNAITGQYVSDPASGLYTNSFTLEPRRYGIAAGFEF